MMERLRVALRTSLRSLAATPAPVVAAIVTLAIAGGVNLAMFGLIDRAILSAPAGLDDPDRIFTLGFQPPGEPASGGLMTTTSYLSFTEIRDGVAPFEAAAFQRAPATVLLDGDQRRVNSMVVSGEYFDVLGARAARGRTTNVRDNEPAARPVAVISDAFWRSALRGDAGVIGRRLSARTIDYEIVGVMPEGFSGHSPLDVDLWVPFAVALRDTPNWDRDPLRRNTLSIVARLDDAANVAVAETQAGAVAGRRVSLRGIVGADVAAADRRVAWWLGGVSMLVFAIGLGTNATLLVVRAARMRYDLALRAMIGASRGRLIAQGMIDATLIALSATLVAWLLSAWLDDAVRSVLFPAVVSRSGVSISLVGTAAITGLLAFLVAATVNIWSLPVNPQACVLAGHAPGGARRSKTMTGLLVMQTAASVLLLAGAAMFAGSLQQVWSQDFGMTMDDVVIVDFELGPERLDGQDEILGRALEQVRQMPGVELATPIGAIPFSGFHVPPIAVPGRDQPPAVGRQLPYLTQVTPEFLKILGVQLIEGRFLNDADDRGSLVVLVNQSMARGVWPGESAVGKCIRIGFDPDFHPATADGPPTPSEKVPCREVVGVVRDLRQRSVVPAGNEDRLMQYFVPFSQVPFPPFVPDPQHIRGLMMRVSTDAAALAPAIRRAVVGDRTDMPIVRVQPYADLLERQVRPWHVGATLLSLFSALAVAVAALGLYAAFAHAVAERRREMAIRMAVGAAPSAVLQMVLRDALLLTGIGAAIGCAAAAGSGRWIQSLLFGIEATDPLVLGAAAAAMLLVAFIATIRPARTASNADPSQLLRTC